MVGAAIKQAGSCYLACSVRQVASMAGRKKDKAALSLLAGDVRVDDIESHPEALN